MTQPHERYTNVAHIYEEDPEEHIGDEVPDPWTRDSDYDEEVRADGDMGGGS